MNFFRRKAKKRINLSARRGLELQAQKLQQELAVQIRSGSSSLAAVLSYCLPIFARRLIILGSSGSGKTYLMRKKIMPLIPDCVLTLFHDPEGDYKYKATLVRSIAELKNQIKKKNNRIRWRDPGMTDKIFKFLMKRGNCLVVVDEADEVFSQNNLNHTRWLIAKKGRHRDIGMILIANAATTIDVNVRRACLGVICGNTLEDKLLLRQKYGIDTVPPDYEFLYSINGSTGVLVA